MKGTSCLKIFEILLGVFLPLTFLHAGIHSTCTDTSQHLDPVKSLQLDSIHPVRFSTHQLWPPLTLVCSGIALDLFHGIKNTQRNLHQDRLKGFHTAVDNMLLFAPVALPYGLDLLGVRGKTDIADRTAILVKGELLMLATSTVLKHSIREQRPDKSNHYSFPSGHAMQIFATATLLSEEYKDRYKWMPYVAYGMASAVGILRMANNKHYLGDVLVGAGLGILTMKLAYWTHRYKWSKTRR